MTLAMTRQPKRPPTTDALMLWVLEHFAEHFGKRCILKGGMALRLLDCPRHTNDIDFVLVPYHSKKEIAGDIQQILDTLIDAEVSLTLHSKMLRARVSLDGVVIVVEASVATEISSEAIATSSLAQIVGSPSQIVRIMAPSVAMANKLAAWNERRLLRDLYDVHFFMTHVGTSFDLPTLKARLNNIQSRLPKLRKRRKMSIYDFILELQTAGDKLPDEALRNELMGLIPEEEMVGLARKIRIAMSRIISTLEEGQSA